MTLPMIVASLETGKMGVLVLPLLCLEQQMERDLHELNIAFVNLTSTGAEELGQILTDIKPQILLTSVEALGNKVKREILRKSRIQIGHIGWDEAMVSGVLICMYVCGNITQPYPGNAPRRGMAGVPV